MNRLLRASYAAIVVLAGIGCSQTAVAAETLRVHVDEATLIKLPDRVGTLIVGNPLIADVAVQAGGMLVVTGKGYGGTNVIALDRQGNVLMDKNVLVQGPSDSVVVVYRGSERETYSCHPRCERRITLGDGLDYFTATLGQVDKRNSQAQGKDTSR